LCPGLIIFSGGKLQHPLGQQGIREHLLQLGVLLLQLLEPPGLVEVHLAELALPAVEGYVRYIKLLARLRDTAALIGIPEDPDLLLRGESFPFHGLGSFRLGPRPTHHPVQQRRVTSQSFC
jgi:hypothetical protein